MAAPKRIDGWKPGDPDRRKRERSLLELTGTEREDHAPEGHPLRRKPDEDQREPDAD